MKLIFNQSKQKKIVKPVKLRFFNTSKFPTRSKAEWKLIDKNPFGDKDKDRVKNFFDCKPLNRKKQGWAHKGSAFPRERSSHVVMMSPDKFLRTTWREFDNQTPAQIGRPRDIEEYEREVINRENVERLKKSFRTRQAKIDIPFLEYDEQGNPIGHEGRHRAIAARELGVKRIPVTIAKRLKESRDWKKIRSGEVYGGEPKKKSIKDYRYDLENEDEIVSAKSADIPIKEQREYGEEKPETLQQLDLNNNQIPDSAENVNIELEEYED